MIMVMSGLARTDGNRVSAVALFDDCLHYRSSCIATAPEATFERPSRPSRRVSPRKTRPRRRRSKGPHIAGWKGKWSDFRMFWDCTAHGGKIKINEFLPSEGSIFPTSYSNFISQVTRHRDSELVIMCCSKFVVPKNRGFHRRQLDRAGRPISGKV